MTVAGIGVVDIDGDFLDRLHLLAVHGLHHHARAADGEFKALAAHGFDQHPQLQFAAARHFKGAFAGFETFSATLPSASRKQALADDAALHLVAFAAGIGAVIDGERHGESRRIDGMRRNGIVHGQVAQRVGHGGGLQAGNGDDCRPPRRAPPAPAPGRGRPSSLVMRVFSMISPSRFRALMLRPMVAMPDSMRPVRMRPRKGSASRVVTSILKGVLFAGQGLRLGRRHIFHDALEQGRQILALVRQLVQRPAVAARGIEVMEVELVVIGFQRQGTGRRWIPGFLRAGRRCGRSC